MTRLGKCDIVTMQRCLGGLGWEWVGCDGSECVRGGCRQGGWMQNRTVQSLASSELACPPRVTPVVMQLQSEEGRNISLKCRVTGKTDPFIILLLCCVVSISLVILRKQYIVSKFDSFIR